MIFDLRIYTLHNNKFAAWLKLYEEYGHPAQVKQTRIELAVQPVRESQHHVRVGVQRIEP